MMEPTKSRRHSKTAKLERDIFGGEFMGARRAARINLEYDELPEGAQKLLALILNIPLPLSVFEKIILDALDEVAPQFWVDVLDNYTPVEWKLLQSMADPSFRREVEDLIDPR